MRLHMISEITKSMKVTQWEENSISSILFAMKSMLLEDHARKSKAVQEPGAYGGGSGGGQGDLGLGRQMDALGKTMARIGAEVSSVVQQQQELMREVATTRSQVFVSLSLLDGGFGNIETCVKVTTRSQLLVCSGVIFDPLTQTRACVPIRSTRCWQEEVKVSSFQLPAVSLQAAAPAAAAAAAAEPSWLKGGFITHLRWWHPAIPLAICMYVCMFAYERMFVCMSIFTYTVYCTGGRCATDEAARDSAECPT